MPTARNVSHKTPPPEMATVDATANEILACLNDLVGCDASKAVKADAVRTIIEVATSYLRRLERE